MTTATVRRLVRSNFSKIEDDARCALPDNTLFTLVQYRNPREEAALVVHNGTFAGVYNIVKVSGPRWIGDYGYTFVRTLDNGATITLNNGYEPYEKSGAKTATEARELHLAMLAQVINAPAAAVEVEAPAAAAYVYACKRCGAQHTTREAVDSVYCESAWRDIEVTLISAPAVEAAEVATTFAEVAKDAASLVRGLRQAERIAALVEDFGADKTADYINNRMAAGDFYDMCAALGCRFEARAAIFSALSHVEAKTRAEFDRIFVAGRGTLRIERRGYVVIAHCSTSETIEVVRLRRTRWYVTTHREDYQSRRAEFDASLTYDQLSQWINNVIDADAS
jgi:hypothetical protein